MELFALIAPYFLWTVVAILGAIFLAYFGVLIYDELTSRTNDFYELMLTIAVGIEYVLRGGRPKSNVEYHGRHRSAEKFIDDLVDDLRVRPGSLCYDKKLALKVRKQTPSHA